LSPQQAVQMLLTSELEKNKEKSKQETKEENSPTSIE